MKFKQTKNIFEKQSTPWPSIMTYFFLIFIFRVVCPTSQSHSSHEVSSSSLLSELKQRGNQDLEIEKKNIFQSSNILNQTTTMRHTRSSVISLAFHHSVCHPLSLSLSQHC
jgi:hypothetical protein